MKESKLGSLTPYSERNGVGAAADIESLFSDPENPLPEDELTVAYSFGTGLFRGQLDNIKCESTMDLEQLRQRKAIESIQTFYLGYFATEDGKKDLAKLNLRKFNIDVIAAALNNIDLVKKLVDETARKEIATRSLKWYKAKLEGQLANNPDDDLNFIDEPQVDVNYEPDKLLEKVGSLQAYRKFFREVRRQLKDDQPSDLWSAKNLLLDIHISRVTNQLADLYPSVLSLAQQLANSKSNKKTVIWRKQLDASMPFIKRAVLRKRNKRFADLDAYQDVLAIRLDFLKHGAAWQDDRELSPISNELEQLVAELAEDSPETDAPVPRIEVKTLEKLDETRWDASQTKEFIETILKDWDLLSEHTSTWDKVEARDGFAEDNKWQVTISPDRSSFLVSGAKRVVWVPEDFDRTLTQMAQAGVLPVVAHELEHVFQEEYNYKIATTMPIAKTVSKRIFTQQEAGAVLEEGKMQAIFGRIRPVNTHYFMALKAKLNGDNKLSVMRAYYNSRTQGSQLDEKEAKKNRKTAVNTSLRLYRHGGFNSQPLDYAEQELLSSELRKLPGVQAETVLTTATCFSLQDLARLHKFGLLNIPQAVPISPAEGVWKIFTEKYLPDIIGQEPKNPT